MSMANSAHGAINKLTKIKCEKNAKILRTGSRAFIVALKNIMPEEEVFLDYAIHRRKT
jgi:hypothetical protein